MGWHRLILTVAMCAPILVFAAHPPLQPRVDEAEENATLMLEPGTYAGPVVVDKPRPRRW